MSNFPETNPQHVVGTLNLALAGTESTEFIVMKTKKQGSITDLWGMTDVAAAADADLAVTFYNRGTAFSGTVILCALNGAGTAWGATTPKVGTVTYGSTVAAESYISCAVTRANGSTATAHVLTVGVTFVPGIPGAVGAIDT
jgi:hypothetical protein